MKRPGGAPLILNVDDDDAGRYTVSRQLKKAGYETVEATTGEEALRLARSRHPDLILLDVRLPDIDGFEVCRRLRADAEISGIPVLQMSASYRDMSSQVKGLENGADGYLTEPTEPAFLTATINSLLRMKTAEQRLRQAALQWQTTFNAVRDGFAILNMQGNIVQSNLACTGLLQSDPEGVTAAIQALFERLRTTRERTEGEETFAGQTLAFAVDPVLDDTQELTGAVCSISDITSRKRFEAQLRQTQKLESIGVLAGGIAHDFNNLLTGILGNASLLLDMLPETDPAHKIAAEIVLAGDSAALLTRQMLAYAGKGKMMTLPLNLSAAVLESQLFIRRFIPKNVNLIIESDPSLPLIEADASQIQQVIMNLIINAAEAFDNSRGGSITVRTSRQDLDPAFFFASETAAPGTYAVLTVSDNGSGMDEATQSRIFEPFYTTKFMGRGLGLAAVHGIVAGHNGVLRLHSELGRGTTFQLYFPASAANLPAATVQKEQRAQPKSPPSSGTVLVIDDESAVRNFARHTLENMGYRVLTANDGTSGVELFRAIHEEVDLVLLDLTMPGMNGDQAFDELRLVSPGVRVVLSSGFTESVASERFKGKRLQGFLSKPYTAPQIGVVVRKALSPR